MPQERELPEGAADTSVPRFAADAMLGRLAKWLRLLGYDTLYDPTLDDAALATVARAEERIVLTRDHALSERRGTRSILVTSQVPREQLSQLRRELGIGPVAPLSRCSLCNHPLEAMERDRAEGLVPPYVFATHTRFWRCAACGRLYWLGSHCARMGAVMGVDLGLGA